uniref:Uncharacterized protein n=1 Tax=Romanomermis culicivorax TaxID=13658 RepID=A0A915IEY3_ROMCU
MNPLSPSHVIRAPSCSITAIANPSAGLDKNKALSWETTSCIKDIRRELLHHRWHDSVNL